MTGTIVLPPLLTLTDYQSEEAVNAIKEWARALLAAAGLKSLPFDPCVIAERAGIKITSAPAIVAGNRGMLVPSGLTDTILVNVDETAAAQRYTVAHELVEKALRNGSYEIAARTGVGLVRDKTRRAIEQLCEIGAAEILMPMEYFLPKLRMLGYSITSLLPLADQFGASLAATLWRIVDTGLERCIAAIWEFKHKPSDRIVSATGQVTLWGEATDYDPPKRLRLVTSHCSPGVSIFLPRYKHMDEATSIYRAYVMKGIEMGIENFHLGELKGKYYVESLPHPFRDDYRVLSLVYLDRVDY